MKQGLASLLLLLLLVAPLPSQGAAVFEEILRITCDGSVHLLPSGPTGARFQFPVVFNAYNEATRTLYDRAKCVCPSATHEDIMSRFDFFTAMIANLNPEMLDRPGVSECIADFDSTLDFFFARTWRAFDPFKMDLPNTCSVKTWLEGDQACSMKWLLPTLSIELRLALGRCEGSFAPSMSLTCDGEGCSKLLAPCTKDSDCARYHSCIDLALEENSNFVIEDMTLPEGVFDILKSALSVYDDSDQSPGCYQAARKPGAAKTPQNDIMTNIMTFVSELYIGGTGTKDKMAFCALDKIFDLKSGGLEFLKPFYDQFKVTTSSIPGDSLDSCLAETEFISGLNKTQRVKASFGNLRPWDGRDQTGTHVLDRADQIPQLKPLENQEPEKRLLAELSCSHDLTFPSHGFGFLFEKRVPQFTNHVFSLLKDLTACRSNPASTDPQVFLARYGAWAPLLWLYATDPSAKSLLPLPKESDWLEVFEVLPSITNLPNTCNMQRFLSEGICEFDFTGLKDLLLLDLTIRVTMQTCGGESLFSSARLECLGEDCVLFDGLNPCDLKSECPGNLECVDSVDALAFILNEALGNDADDFLKDPKKTEDLFLNTDFVYLFFSKKFQSNTCDVPSFYPTRTAESLISNGRSNNHQCFGASWWRKDLQRTVLSLLGARQQNQGIIKPLHFCLPGKALMTKQNAENWAKNVVAVSGSSVKLNPNYFKDTIKEEDSSAPSLHGGLFGGVMAAIVVAVIVLVA